MAREGVSTDPRSQRAEVGAAVPVMGVSGLVLAPTALPSLSWADSPPVLFLLVGLAAWTLAFYTFYLWRVRRSANGAHRAELEPAGTSLSSPAGGPGKEN